MNRIIPSELQKAYQNTNYKVFTKEKEILLRVKYRSLEMDELLIQLGEDKFIFITAANPYSIPNSNSENQILNQILENKIIDLQKIYYYGVGESPDRKWKEDSFCVIGISLKNAMNLARNFSQNGILFGKKDQPTKIVWTF
ncbi:MAG: DUF3293 domain-containing protein [Leptospiraceae bacterium]|nr:DUF3293 domain-containing protein [Leptospiraceae bacterium]